MQSRRGREGGDDSNQQQDLIHRQNNNNNQDFHSSASSTSEGQQELGLALRQAAVRCLHRFDQERTTFFDSLFTIFCLYFANAKILPVVKLIYDSQFREDYTDIESFLANVLTTTSENAKKEKEHEAEISKNHLARLHHRRNQVITQDEMKQLLDELAQVAEVVEVQKSEIRQRLAHEKEVRMNTLQLNLNAEAEEYFETFLEDDSDNIQYDINNSDDDDDEDNEIDNSIEIPDNLGLNEMERATYRTELINAKKRAKSLRRYESLLERCSFFGICKDFLESGQAVAKAVSPDDTDDNTNNTKIHPAVADEAAALVSAAGPNQLPKIIDTLEVLTFSDSPGIDKSFYDVVTKIARLSLSRQKVAIFVERFKRDEENDPAPPPPPQLPFSSSETGATTTTSDEQAINKLSDVERIARLNKRQTRKEVEALMERVGESLGADEVAFVDEVVLNNRGVLVTASGEATKQETQDDWSKVQQDWQQQNASTSNQQQQQNQNQNQSNNNSTLSNTTTFAGREGPRRDFQVVQNTASLITQQLANGEGTIKLVKPERFAKLITGFTNSRFNRTHYNHENPPPKHIMAYEFTLYYPGKRDPSKPPKFRVLPAEKGADDEYCYLEIDGERPYAPVAYRIVNRKWDPRRTKATFDPSGKFRLYIAFKTSGYKR